jgi:hypothetical protein
MTLNGESKSVQKVNVSVSFEAYPRQSPGQTGETQERQVSCFFDGTELVGHLCNVNHVSYC